MTMQQPLTPDTRSRLPMDPKRGFARAGEAATNESSRLRHLVSRIASALVAVAALTAAAPSLADPSGRVGRVAEAQGNVWLLDDHQGQWIAATRNRPVTQGDRLSVQGRGKAVIHIGSATLRVDGDTEIEVLRLDDRGVGVQLHGGTVALQLPVTDSAREFQISTLESRVQAQERAHFRVDRQNGITTVSAWDGALRVDSPDASFDMQRGQKSDVWLERGRTHQSWVAMDRDAFTDWVVSSERRDESLSSYRHVSPEMTGAHDLGRYGTWDTHPQYGAIWYPHSVAAQWAPYRDGTWAWVEPWGWTWVDNAPWGFAPFHYGRWVMHRGRWCWVPGSYVSRPVYAPALVAWYGGNGLSVTATVPGHHHSHPHVGWVALAPFEVFSPWYRVSSAHVHTINVAPWRDVRGYQAHPHSQGHSHAHGHGQNHGGHGMPFEHANRGAGWTVVPQRVLTDRQPIRQDVITPAQAAVWRGGVAGAQGAMVVPPSRAGAEVANGSRASREGRDGRDARDGSVDRDDARMPGPMFVPPAIVAARQAAPSLPPNSSRAVPWVRAPGVAQPAVVIANDPMSAPGASGSQGVSPNRGLPPGMTRGGAEPIVVPSAPPSAAGIPSPSSVQRQPPVVVTSPAQQPTQAQPPIPSVSRQSPQAPMVVMPSPAPVQPMPTPVIRDRDDRPTRMPQPQPHVVPQPPQQPPVLQPQPSQQPQRPQAAPQTQGREAPNGHRGRRDDDERGPKPSMQVR